jgi:hypothetical protein
MNPRTLIVDLLLGIAIVTPMCAAQQTRPTTKNSGAILTLDELFAQLDKNHDGVISKDEATGIYAQRFLRWDTKGRGYVTRQELHDFRVAHGIDDNGQRILPGGGAATPSILKEPADWRFETFPVPPPFAPDVKLKGSEEARFSPGMYDTTSSNYFTYAVAITAQGSVHLGGAELKEFLEKYFRGLSGARAQRKGVASDIAQMLATVTPAQGPDHGDRFAGQMIFFDSFTDGRKVTLNVEAQVIDRPATKQTFLILLISPSPTDSAVWKDLREIGRKAVLNIQ